MNGYLTVDHAISAAEAERIKHAWREAMASNQPALLGYGVTFHKFDASPLDPVIVRCGHCGQWAAIQTECKHCGAPIL